jgi:phenylalanyl-tRNA synthetase beta chain
LWDDKDGIDIANPLRHEESRLRTCLLPSLLQAKKYNMNHGVDQVRIFEIAKVYLAGNEKLPLEKTCLSAIADVDFYNLKGVVEALLSNLGIAAECEWIPYETSRSILLFKTGKVAQIKWDGNILGYLGESCESEFKPPPCMMELDMDLLMEKSNFIKKYKNLSLYPPVFRDLAIIVNEAYLWSDIQRCIKYTKINFLREINFFDVYRGKQIPAGKKSIAFNLCFQSPDRTLSSEEVDVELQAIIDSLQRTLNAELRKI